MALFSEFWKFIQRKLMGGKTYNVSGKDIAEFIDGQKWNELAIYEFALHAGINIIANALSACEVRTFDRWEECRKEQYYLWNFEPNMNMNASQFKQKLVWSLIYKNECLVIQTNNGQFLIADSYEHEQYALKPDIFRNVTVGADGSGISAPYTFKQEFRMEDVLFYRLSNRNITTLLNQLMTEYEDLLKTAIQKFYKSGGERGVIKIDANAPAVNYGVKEDGTARTFNDVYTELMNNQFATYFKSPNAVLPLFKGFDYDTKGGEASKKSTSEVKDVTDLTDEIYDRVANALQIPPALLKGDIADVTALTKNLITFAIDPIAKTIETENNRKLYHKNALDGTYQMIDTSRIMHMSASEIAVAGDKMIGCGGWNIDDVRKMAGDAPINKPWSKKHHITLNYGNLDSGTNPDKTGDDTKLKEGGDED